MTTSFSLNEGQREALRILAGPARHIFLRGGSRSGKTVVLMRAVIIRALRVADTRHGIFRHTLSAARATLLGESLPTVMRLCFPGIGYDVCRQDSIVRFGNGSNILFGGLDRNDRTEKILGHQFSTVYLNEASQISYRARNMLLTRLAEKSSLKLKEYIDANPPSTAHWLYRLFERKEEPDSGQPLERPDLYQSILLNPDSNKENLPDEYFGYLEGLPERERARFLRGEYASVVPGALWKIDEIKRDKLVEDSSFSYIRDQLRRIVVSVDPSGASGPDDFRSDEVGVVVCGIDDDDVVHILEDCSLRDSPAAWARQALNALDRWRADMIVAERNFGGALVEANIRSMRAHAPLKLVTASRGKVARAEPVASLYERHKVVHHGRFQEIEEQLALFSTTGYKGDRSPDRADALVWGVTELALSGGLSEPSRWISAPVSFER